MSLRYPKLLRQLRTEAHKSQAELAEVLGTSQTMYARYERGANALPLRHLLTLCEYYDVSADYLLGRTSSSIPIDLLQKRLADGKTVSDLISIFLRLSPDRQHALLLILSDMDLLHSVINQCGRRDQ